MSLENVFRKMMGQDPAEPCVDAKHGVKHPYHTWVDFAFYPPGAYEPQKKKFHCKGVK